jgi:hypothetical protein
MLDHDFPPPLKQLPGVHHPRGEDSPFGLLRGRLVRLGHGRPSLIERRQLIEIESHPPVFLFPIPGKMLCQSIFFLDNFLSSLLE